MYFKVKNMFRYAVIVCTKCRQHAQIIENDDKKTTKCQNCGSTLNIDKLRFFYQCDNIDDAVSARTKVQSQIQGQEQIQDISEHMGFIDATKSSEYKPVSQPNKDKSKHTRFKKDERKIIINLLESNNGEMERSRLKSWAFEKGVDSDKFEKIIDSMLKTGELYSPSMTDILKLVP